MRLSKEDLIQRIKQALKQAGTSQMSQSPYDLGWLLRLPAGRHGLLNFKNLKKPRYSQIISWLEKLQHKDGSWGGQIPFAHDRVISTLSVVAGLSRWPLDDKWRGRIAKAVKAVEFYSKKLLNEPEATVAFELLFPKLLQEVQNSGYKINVPNKVLTHYQNLQKQKLAKLPIEVATKYPTTLLHALEALDESKIDLKKFEKFQSPGGSFGCSPATTAFMLLQGIGGKKAEHYLNNLIKKGVVPVLWPMEIFEINWCLFPFFLFDIDKNFSRLINSHIQYLKKEWTALGSGLSKEFGVPDIDDTLTAFYLLQKSGVKVDPAVFERFEINDGFVCYPGERGGSASHYADLIFAFETCAPDSRIKRMREKIINFLLKTQRPEGFWDDKWNISPYYATSRVIMALARDRNMSKAMEKAVCWIMKTQHNNGLWGLQNGTAEETAFALTALFFYNKKISPVDSKIVKRGFKALIARFNSVKFPELWLGKSLYTPKAIAETNILAALFVYLYEK